MSISGFSVLDQSVPDQLNIELQAEGYPSPVSCTLFPDTTVETILEIARKHFFNGDVAGLIFEDKLLTDESVREIREKAESKIIRCIPEQLCIGVQGDGYAFPLWYMINPYSKVDEIISFAKNRFYPERNPSHLESYHGEILDNTNLWKIMTGDTNTPFQNDEHQLLPYDIRKVIWYVPNEI